MQLTTSTSPNATWAFYDALVAFDHLENRTYLVSTGFPEMDESRRQRRAEARLNELKNMVVFAPPPAPEKVSKPRRSWC